MKAMTKQISKKRLKSLKRNIIENMNLTIIEYEFNDYMEGYNDSMEAAIKIAEQLDSV